MKLSDFPLEILEKIFSYLSTKDILNASETCKALREASEIDSVWHRRCTEDFKAGSQAGALPFKVFYQKVLYPLRHLLGLWQADIVAYGGLLLVKCISGGVEGWELCAPRNPHIKDPLRIKPLFRITQGHDAIVPTNHLDIRSNCICLGHPNPEQKMHNASIHFKGLDCFEFKCSQPSSHLNPVGRQQDFLAWLREEQGGQNPGERGSAVSAGPFLYNEELLLMKFLSLRHHDYQYQFHRLDLSSNTALDGREPVPPGLFCGTYGAHGLEIIHLTYEIGTEGQPKAKAVKITGDPNVPAEQLTFHVNLNYPITLVSEEEQRAISALEALHLEEVPFTGCSDKTPHQPFVIPTDCFERSEGVPNVCRHRFHGWGQIAGHGFTNPSFSKGHWIVFNEDQFGFLWLELLSLSMFHRIKDLDP